MAPIKLNDSLNEILPDLFVVELFSAIWYVVFVMRRNYGISSPSRAQPRLYHGVYINMFRDNIRKLKSIQKKEKGIINMSNKDLFT